MGGAWSMWIVGRLGGLIEDCPLRLIIWLRKDSSSLLPGYQDSGNLMRKKAQWFQHKKCHFSLNHFVFSMTPLPSTEPDIPPPECLPLPEETESPVFCWCGRGPLTNRMEWDRRIWWGVHYFSSSLPTGPSVVSPSSPLQPELLYHKYLNVCGPPV